jgi:predicted transcriptional regulator
MRSWSSASAPSAEALVGPLEYECLSALWQLGAGNVGDVRKMLNTERDVGDRLAYTTVMTVLVRLHEKAIVDRSKQGRSFVYTPRCSETELVERLSRKAVDELLATYGNVAVAQFASAMRDIDPQQLAALRAIIAEDADDEGDGD